VDFIKEDIRKNRLLEKGSYYFSCYLPQNIYLSSRIDDNTYEYRDIVIEAIVTLYSIYNKGEGLEEEFREIPKNIAIPKLPSILTKATEVFNTDSIYAIELINNIDISLVINTLLSTYNNKIEE